MLIVMIAVNDPAGAAVALTDAINRYSPHTCRLITLELRYNFIFKKDLHIPWLSPYELNEVEHLLQHADIFHFHMTADEDLHLGPFTPKKYIAGKTLVHHHHGHPDFRGNPQFFRDKYAKRNRKKLLVSTPDLLNLLPSAFWMPNVVPVNDVLYMPNHSKSKETINITHSPTRKDLKNTNEFLEITTSLIAKYPHIQRILIENTPHKECLRLKRSSHIIFDHLQGYFGISSLESLSQGLCVVAGLDEHNQKYIKDFTGADRLPWIISSLSDLYKDIEQLVCNTDYREEISSYSRSFMESFWNEQIIVDRLINFYEQ